MTPATAVAPSIALAPTGYTFRLPPELRVNREVAQVPDIVTQEDEKVTKTYVVTSYTAGPESTGKRPGDRDYGITASGERVKAGVTAACPHEIPFGTRIRIENVGVRVCSDRGGDIRGKRIDVYTPRLHDARAFGRQTLEVEIMTRGSD